MLDNITRIHFFRPIVMIFKILRGIKQSAPNAVSRNGWIFRYSKSRLRCPSIYLYGFSICHSLSFSKRFIDKHLSDSCPNHSMLHSSATQKQSATLQRVDCNINLNLNRVLWSLLMAESPIKWSFAELQIDYLNSSRSDAVERHEMKKEKKQNNCLRDSGNTGDKNHLLSNRFFLKFFFIRLGSN